MRAQDDDYEAFSKRRVLNYFFARFIMTRKQLLIKIILITAFSLPLYSAAKNPPSKTPPPKKPNQQLADDQMISPNQCSALTQDEQNFAKNLNDMNAMMFCTKMSPVQRQKAMQMSTMRGPNGNKMTPDDAVQNVMGTNPNNGRQRGTGACPVQ